MTTQMRKFTRKDKISNQSCLKDQKKETEAPSPKLLVAWNKEPPLTIYMVLVAKNMNIIMLFYILHSILLSRECSPNFLPDKLLCDSRIFHQKRSNICTINRKGMIKFMHCTLIYFAHWDHDEFHIVTATI